MQLACGGEIGLEGLIRCHEALGCGEQAEYYRRELEGRDGIRE